MRDTAHIGRIIAAYREFGFLTALDDFGAGYAGLGLLAGFFAGLLGVGGGGIMVPILAMLFRDWTPELQANARCYNDWVASNPEMPVGQLVSVDGKRRVHPTLGPIDFPLRESIVRRASAPQTLWHFDIAAAEGRSLSGAAFSRFTALMQQTGGTEAMALQLARPIVRRDYALEVG